MNPLISNINPKKMKMNMKKIISWGMMLAAAFTLTNCAKEIEDPNQQPEKQGYPFEIVASTVDTKTVNEGMATKWDDDDAINLFHAEAGAEVYGANDKFTIADVEACRFTGELTAALETTKSYDWYALYPYNSNIATPGDRADGYTYIGHSKGLNQTGYDNMTSLKETICPLYGVAKAVASSDTPSITMNHLTSVVAIKVTNTTEEPLTITTASLTAEEDIVGSYFIDITKSPVVYKASEGFVKNTAVVNVSDGTALAKGESATLYLAIKPFTAKAGTSLTLSVNDYAKEPKVLTSDVTFHAGKIKTLNFAYDKVAPKNVTWDLSKNETSEATATKIAWVSSCVSVVNEKGGAETPTNNYYGGDANNRTSTRFYKGSNLTIAPVSGYAITSVVFAATSTSYASDFAGSTWTNAVTSADEDNKVTIIPLNGIEPVNAKITGTCGFTSIVVNYVSSAEYEQPEPPVLTSITLSGQKTDYFVGDEFGFDGTVTANYSYGSSKFVTDYTVSTPDMSSEGTETVTVTYSEDDVTVSESYEITLTVKPEVDQPTDGPLVWTLVTNVSDLAVGDEIIIAAKDYGYAISTTQNNNNRGQAAITKNGNTLDTPGTSVQILTLAQGSSSGTFAFYTGSNYLYAASSSNNYLKQQTTLNANGSWKVTIANDGTATIVAQGTNTRNTMQYNQSSGLFACYASASQKALVIYKQMPSSGDVGGTTPEPEEPETPVEPTPDPEPETNGYTKYTGELVEGDYIIVYSGKAMKATISSNRLGYDTVTASNDVISDPNEAVVWHIAKSGSYWTIYNASVNKYAASTGTKNQAQLLASGTDNKSLWTVSGTATYEFVNKNNKSNSVNANLRNNGTYGFACYATSTGGALTLYKKN